MSKPTLVIENIQESDFIHLCDFIRQRVNFFGVNHAASPDWKKDDDLVDIRKKIDEAAYMMPPTYRDDFLTPLRDNFDRLKVLDHETFNAVVGCILQLNNPRLQGPLCRFLAVISNMYRSFADEDKRRRTVHEFTVVPATFQLPPLVFWQHVCHHGPFSLHVQDVNRLIDGDVGIIGVPATVMDHPVLWMSLAAQLASYDMLHADAGLIRELAISVRSVFSFGGHSHGKPLHEITESQRYGYLWGYWMDTAAADVYGILKWGPSYAFNLAVSLAVSHFHQKQIFTHPILRTISFPDKYGALDPHPTDILRIYICIGAIEKLIALNQSTKDMYVRKLKEIATWCCKGEENIMLFGNLAMSRYFHPFEKLDGLSFPLKTMRKQARAVGGYITNAKLRVLENHTLQGIETWDEEDEATANRICNSILRNKRVYATLGDDSQYLAGSTLAILKNPEQYYEVMTTRLNGALDRSFQTDPTWGLPHRHSALVCKPPAFKQRWLDELAKGRHEEEIITPSSVAPIEEKRGMETQEKAGAQVKKGNEGTPVM
jgi:hypothetical protein